MHKCDYCGNPIQWIKLTVETTEGQEIKNIAVDAKEPVYHNDGEKWIQSRAFVNHFAVCPFRRKWRKQQQKKVDEFQKQKTQPWWVK